MAGEIFSLYPLSMEALSRSVLEQENGAINIQM
jgi:hypothetical protein